MPLHLVVGGRGRVDDAPTEGLTGLHAVPSIVAPVSRPGNTASSDVRSDALAVASPGTAGTETATAAPRPDTAAVRQARHRPQLSLAELLLLLAATVVGAVALVSLIAAHLGQHRLGVIIPASAVVLVAVIAAVWTLGRPQVVIDRGGLAPAVVGMVLMGVLAIPGFRYATGDRDPGAYVEHAVAISRTHSTDIPDDLDAPGVLPDAAISPGAQWPALWNKQGAPGARFRQFYHLWPALLATSYELGGFTLLFDTGPLLAVIALGLAVAVARRLAGWPGAWAVALILPTNMLEVWQAKYPTAEIFGQLLFLAAVLGTVLAVRSRWLPAAVAAGSFVGLSLLERADGILLVLIAWLALCALLAVRRFDVRAAGFTVGLLAVLPYAFWQAYHLAANYTAANDVPSLRLVLGVMIGAAVVVAGVAMLRSSVDRVVSWTARPRVRLIVGTLFVGVCGALMLLGLFRSRLFGADYQHNNGTAVRTYDEASLVRLSWFFSVAGLALLLAGFAAIAWRRWRFDTWLVGLTTATLLAFYCYHVRNSPYLMWSTRRFVTTVVPGMVLVMGCGVALVFLVLRRWLRTVVSAVAVSALIAGLAIFGLRESWPLRHHDENGGSVQVLERIAEVAGDDRGVFLWQNSGPGCPQPYLLFGGPLLAIEDQSSALLPGDPAQTLPVYEQHFRATGRPVFYVTGGGQTPPSVPGLRLTPVLDLTGSLPHWDETFDTRPRGAHPWPYTVAVYRVTAT